MHCDLGYNCTREVVDSRSDRRADLPMTLASPSPCRSSSSRCPPAPRLRRRGPSADPARPRRRVRYVQSPDGLAITSQGRGAASLLPKADTVVVVLADTDVSWHRITAAQGTGGAAARRAGRRAGRGAARRARDVHLALAPGSRRPAAPGSPRSTGPGCAANCRRWRRPTFVDRVVPRRGPTTRRAATSRAPTAPKPTHRCC